MTRSMTSTFLQIDLQNIFYEARNKNVKIDFEKILKHFNSRESEFLTEAIIYMVRGEDFDSDKFEAKLLNIGYKIFAKNSTKSYKGQRIIRRQTKYDINMVIDCLDRIENFNKLLFISGDGGFSDLFRHLKNKGKQIEVWSFEESYSTQIEPYVDRIHFINEEFFYKRPKVTVFGFGKYGGPIK